MLWRPPADFENLCISNELVEETLAYLREFGRVENIAYWAGVEQDKNLWVKRLVKPKAARERRYVFVHAEEVARVVLECHENHEFLIAQIHTHPGEEDHSETDDCGTVSKRDGFVSLVVTHYAAGATVAEPRWFGYQLQHGAWFPFDMSRIRCD
jgi:hypothetical protein